MLSSHPTASYQLFVGVDIAAATVTVAWQRPEQPPSKPLTLDQDPEAFHSLHSRLVKTGIRPEHILLVMEATGIYWLTFATFFVRLGYAISVVNPIQTHHFAKALLKRAKTDAIDAQTLTRLAALLQPSLWTPPPPIYEQLEQRLSQRDDLLLMRVQLRNQLHALRHRPVQVAQVRQRMEMLDQMLTEQIVEIEDELSALVLSEDELPAGSSPEEENSMCAWTKNIARLQTIPGIGLISALWIVVSTMNFTLCSSVEQAAAYAGLAPMPRQSGTSVQKRPCIGHSGNARLRTTLYMATLSAARYNPFIKPFYERLRAAGKPAKVARCAAARKLLHLAFALVKHQQDFNPLYQEQQAA